MKRSAHIWRGVLAALMTLAAILVWSPLVSEAASPTVHAATTASHSHQAHTAEISSQRALHVTLDTDCQASAIGCCMMAHCCPGISVGAHEMTKMAVSDETTAAEAVRGLGSDPGLIVPPPRRPWLGSLEKSYIQENSR